VEQIPSSGESARGGKRGKPLPEAVSDRLKRRTDPADRQLEALASDPALGAPVAAEPAVEPEGSTAGREITPDPSAAASSNSPEDALGKSAQASDAPSPPSVADAGATSASGLGSPLVLLLVLAGVTVAAVLTRRASKTR